MKKATKASNLHAVDIISLNLFFVVFFGFSAYIIYANHRAISSYDRISRLLRGHDQAPVRNLNILIWSVQILWLVAELINLMNMVNLVKINLNVKVYAATGLFGLFMLLLRNLSFWPAVVLIRFLHSMEWKMSKIKNGNDNYLSEVANLMEAKDTLDTAFSGNVLGTMALNVLSMIIGIYYLISISLGSPDQLATMIVVPLVAMPAMPILILLYLTSAVEAVLKQVRRIEADLYALSLDSKLDEDTKIQAKILKRQCKTWSGLDACGFFSVNRSLLTAIVGQLLTYVIILVEFKLNSLEDNNGDNGDKIDNVEEK